MTEELESWVTLVAWVVAVVGVCYCRPVGLLGLIGVCFCIGASITWLIVYYGFPYALPH